MTDLSLDRYFRRIGYDGPREATLPVLETLHRLQPEAIPFENLDPFLGQPVRLDRSAIEQKLVAGGRGGYCYELNLLFLHVLQDLGFEVTGLSARVLWGYGEKVVMRRSHMLLRVELDGRTFIADVGFGGLTLKAPLASEPGLLQETPHEEFRMVEADGLFRVEGRIAAAWRPLYCFDLSEHFEADYEIASFFMSTHPSSHFTTDLILARTLPDPRLAYRNGRLSVHHSTDGTENRNFQTAGELSDAVAQLFGISLSDRTALEHAALTRGTVPG